MTTRQDLKRLLKDQTCEFCSHYRKTEIDRVTLVPTGPGICLDDEALRTMPLSTSRTCDRFHLRAPAQAAWASTFASPKALTIDMITSSSVSIDATGIVILK
jgi:hypothetical protein